MGTKPQGLMRMKGNRPRFHANVLTAKQGQNQILAEIDMEETLKKMSSVRTAAI